MVAILAAFLLGSLARRWEIRVSGYNYMKSKRHRRYLALHGEDAARERALYECNTMLAMSTLGLAAALISWLATR